MDARRMHPVPDGAADFDVILPEASKCLEVMDLARLIVDGTLIRARISSLSGRQVVRHLYVLFDKVDVQARSFWIRRLKPLASFDQLKGVIA